MAGVPGATLATLCGKTLLGDISPMDSISPKKERQILVKLLSRENCYHLLSLLQAGCLGPCCLRYSHTTQTGLLQPPLTLRLSLQNLPTSWLPIILILNVVSGNVELDAGSHLLHLAWQGQEQEARLSTRLSLSKPPRH